MHLARSKLRLPITLGFVLVITLPLIVVYTAALRSSLVLAHLREHVLPKMAIFSQVVDLDEEFHVISYTMRDLALSKDMASKQQEKERFDHARVKFAEKLANLERMVDSAKGKKITARIKEKWTGIQPTLNRAVVLGMASKPFEGSEVLLAALKQGQASLFEENHLLIEHKIKGARERNEAVYERVANIRVLLFLLGGVALLLGGLIAITTISETKRAEKELQEGEEKYRMLVETMNDGLAAMDQNGLLTYVNPKFSEMLGYQEDELVNRPGIDFLGEADRQIFKEQHLKGMEGDRTPYEIELIRKDQEKIAVIVSPQPVFDGASNFTGSFATFTDITTRRQMEKALRESEEKYRNIFENAVEGIFQTTPDGRLLSANPALAEMLGYVSPQEMLTSITDVSQRYVEVGQRAIFKRTLEEQGVIRGFETQFLRNDGEKIWISIKARVVRDENGTILYYEGFNENITARKQAEERLEAERQRLYALLDGLPAYIYLMAPDHSFRFVNRLFREHFGELAGRNCYEVMRGRQEPCEVCFPARVFENNKPHEWEWTAPNGRIYQLYDYPFVDIDGTPLVLELGIDISARKQAEAAFKDLILSAPIGIYLLQDGKCVLVNPGFQKITGYSEEELLGLRAMSLVAPEFIDHVRKSALKMLRGETSLPYEYQAITKGGETKWIMESVTRTQYAGRGATLGYFMDITGLKQLESQLLRAQKMEAVARLAGGVAHDFNNLLMAVMCLGDMIKEELPTDNRLHQYGEGITKAARQAISLTRQLLAFSRKQVLHPEVINLNKIVKDMEKLLGQFIGEDVNLEIVLNPTLGMVKADPGQMEQVIMNLVVNARDAMPYGGKLQIETSHKDLDEAQAGKYEDLAPGPYVMLSVSDSGVGMDQETQAHIFEPFFTTKDPDKGTGLGLSTVYGIVKQSGGYIEVYSDTGIGTTFNVLLPQVKASLRPAQAEEALTEPLHGQETILVVEDENILRILICSALQGYGYQVLEARDGARALELAQQYEEPIHLMVTDLVMPQMRGTELAEKMATVRPEMKVLFMSGYMEDAGLMQEMLKAGAVFLQKPFGTTTLVEKVHQVLSGSHE